MSVPAPVPIVTPASSVPSAVAQNNALLEKMHRDPRFGPYNLSSVLGQGEFGKVMLGWNREPTDEFHPQQVAIKLIKRESVPPGSTREIKVHREINALKKLNHPNIAYLIDVFKDKKYIGIVMEYYSGGELFEYILRKKRLKEPMARKLFAQLISSVNYMHSQGIVHRDLKLENLLLDKHENIIVTDFGFANAFKKNNDGTYSELMSTSCGSPCYAAPELVISNHRYASRKADIWSCGVILYAMLAGYLPFDDDPQNPEGDNITRLYKYITNTKLTFPDYVNVIARDLLRKIIVVDPIKRSKMKQIIIHPWLSPYSDFLAIPPNEWNHKKRISSRQLKSVTRVDHPSRAQSMILPDSKSLVSNLLHSQLPQKSRQRFASNGENLTSSKTATTTTIESTLSNNRNHPTIVKSATTSKIPTPLNIPLLPPRSKTPLQSPTSPNAPSFLSGAGSPIHVQFPPSVSVLRRPTGPRNPRPISYQPVQQQQTGAYLFNINQDSKDDKDSNENIDSNDLDNKNQSNINTVNSLSLFASSTSSRRTSKKNIEEENEVENSNSNSNSNSNGIEIEMENDSDTEEHEHKLPPIPKQTSSSIENTNDEVNYTLDPKASRTSSIFTHTNNSLLSKPSNNNNINKNKSISKKSIETTSTTNKNDNNLEILQKKIQEPLSPELQLNSPMASQRESLAELMNHDSKDKNKDEMDLDLPTLPPFSESTISVCVNSPTSENKEIQVQKIGNRVISISSNGFGMNMNVDEVDLRKSGSYKRYTHKVSRTTSIKTSNSTRTAQSIGGTSAEVKREASLKRYSHAKNDTKKQPVPPLPIRNSSDLQLLQSPEDGDDNDDEEEPQNKAFFESVSGNKSSEEEIVSSAVRKSLSPSIKENKKETFELEPSNTVPNTKPYLLSGVDGYTSYDNVDNNDHKRSTSLGAKFIRQFSIKNRTQDSDEMIEHKVSTTANTSSTEVHIETKSNKSNAPSSNSKMSNYKKRFSLIRVGTHGNKSTTSVTSQKKNKFKSHHTRNNTEMDGGYPLANTNKSKESKNSKGPGHAHRYSFSLSFISVPFSHSKRESVSSSGTTTTNTTGQSRASATATGPGKSQKSKKSHAKSPLEHPVMIPRASTTDHLPINEKSSHLKHNKGRKFINFLKRNTTKVH